MSERVKQEGSAAGAAERPKKARASPNEDTPHARLVVLEPDDRRTTPQDGARGKPTIKQNAGSLTQQCTVICIHIISVNEYVHDRTLIVAGHSTES
jgi:hypothetical protein